MRDFSFCPDPERAAKDIETFLSEHPQHAEKIEAYMEEVALLFSCSQFLANYCTQYPHELFTALLNLDRPFDARQLEEELRAELLSCDSLSAGMKTVRIFKKKNLLLITLKDILKKADLQEVMSDMSALADMLLCGSLRFVESFLKQRYGSPETDSFVILSLGKLGAQELNYSSDVDINFVYREECETSGIATIQGGTMNRITASEYYSKLAEELTRFLASNTEDGLAYRVDLRLRPQGQKGSLAISLASCEDYYESWGQLWERAALLRTRPVAGDMALGNDFCDMIKPFVYKKYLDTDTIDEIRNMKSQVEQIKAGTLSRDIKRGYGGIREIEFFIQIFQLIYGGKEPLLREKSTFMALHMLLQKRLIGHEDFHHLIDNYVFFRTLEHRLQQMNDLQTHSLPSGERELGVLGRKMGFNDMETFMSELNNRRRKVREIYDSLLESGNAGEEKRAPGVLSRVFWDIENPEEQLIEEELSATKTKNIHKAIYFLMKIRSNMSSFQTIKGRRLLERIIPEFVDDALGGDNPDVTLLQLVDFSAILAAKESYLEAISQKQGTVSLLNFVFTHSGYLSRILMHSPEYLESLFEVEDRKKTLQGLKSELGILVQKHGASTAIRLLRRMEEVRLGMLFLNRKIGVTELMRSLSKTAEAVFSTLSSAFAPNIAVVAFGKLGGREITFNSDLDVIFVTEKEPSHDNVRDAEKLLKVFMSYTKDGIAYHVDTRLRPEGSKGPLVTSIAGLMNYYLNNAHPWELQALLKARPLLSDAIKSSLNIEFNKMRGTVLRQRGEEITGKTIREMRERIEKERAKEAKGFDIKLGPGGLEELEFSVQYMQLKHCINNSGLLVQATPDAVKRLNIAGPLSDKDASVLTDTYTFYRTIETMLRLQNESVLKEEGAILQGIAGFMGLGKEDFLDMFNQKRQEVNSFWNNVTSDRN